MRTFYTSFECEADARRTGFLPACLCDSTPAQRLVGSANVAMRSFGGPFSDSRRDWTEMRYTVPGLVATASRLRSAENERPVGRVPPRLSGPFKGNWPRVCTGLAWANSTAESSGRV